MLNMHSLSICLLLW